MEYLHEFATKSDCTNYINSDNYKEPFTALVDENGSIVYNKSTQPSVHDYVEIGGIKWATMNLGATAVTDYGKYYAWGETTGYYASQVGTDKNFSWADYELCDGTSSNMTKYNSTDGLTTLQTSDDAVVQEWGGNWRMPTTTEWESLEIAANTAWTSDYQGSGVAGLVCTDNNDSSKVLFFPSAGYCAGGSVSDIGYYGGYWCSSVYSSNTVRSYSMFLSYGEVSWYNHNSRYYGLSVRGILNE